MQTLEEIIPILQGIKDGKPWQKRPSSPFFAWVDSPEVPNPIDCLSNGWELRLKPAPEPVPDPYADAKQWLAEGRLQANWGTYEAHDWRDCSDPKFKNPKLVHCYRRRPDPVWVDLSPDDVRCGDEIRLPSTEGVMSIFAVTASGIWVMSLSKHTPFPAWLSFSMLNDVFQIRRRDSDVFVPCQKESK